MKKNVIKLLEAILSNKVPGEQNDNDIVLIHPQCEDLKDLTIPEIDNMLIQLEKTEVIKVQKFPNLSMYYDRDGVLVYQNDHNMEEFHKCYCINLLENFDKFASRILNLPSEKNGQLSLWINYSETSREIILNDTFILSKPNFGSTNELVFKYLYKNPNRIISIKELEREATRETISKRLHDIVQELGFKKELRKAFFNISKTNITFKNPVSQQDLTDLDIRLIKISVN